jgi:hypothetical protein
MDGTAFDALIKQFSTSRVTRAEAVRRLVSGATALAGVRLTADDAGADKKGETKKKWCHRGDNVAILGITKKLTKEQRKQHKRKHVADYEGKCIAARIVAPTGGAAPLRPFCAGKNRCTDMDQTTVCNTDPVFGCFCWVMANGSNFCGGPVQPNACTDACTQAGGACVDLTACGDAALRCSLPCPDPR